MTFYAGSVIVQDLITRKTIGAGYELQILYHLFASPVALISTTIELIHNPSVVKLQKLVPSLSAISYLECEPSQSAKQTRVSFSKQVNTRATSMFDIVYLNI